jgi:hypothetical protein
MIEAPEEVPVKKITSYPILWGVLIAFLIGGVTIAMETWFPRIGEALGRHERLAQAVFFTAAFFAVCVYTFWEWHNRRTFWLSLCTFFLVHSLGVFFYSTHVHVILVWQWTILLILESYLAAFFVGLSTRWFGHPDKRVDQI